MKKVKLKAVITTALIFSIATGVFVSCKSHYSVREMKAREDPNAGIQVGEQKVKTPSVPKEIMTKPLFMQSQYVTIELPEQKGNGKGGVRTLTEKVEFVNQEKIGKPTLDSADQKIDLSKDQQLSEVVVAAQSRFTPERNGKVNVDFIIKVPKSLLSDNWRVTISPTLMHNDSVVALKDIVIKGREFYEKQKLDYKNYDDYLKSIVKKSDYDSVFLDKDGIREDIRNRQQFYYGEYYDAWKKVMVYDKWKTSIDGLSFAQRAKLRGVRDKLYNEYGRKANEQSVRYLAQGKDTTGIWASHMREFEKRSMRILQLEMSNDKKLEKVPGRFRELIESGLTLDEILNGVVSQKDSIKIVQYRYKVDEIALNEMKEERKDEMFIEMVPFPTETGIRLDTIAETAKDFIYLYRQDHPVTAGLKKIGVLVNAKVDAVDMSSYVFPTSDTLSYFVSSLAQLADTSMIYSRKLLYRDLYNKMTISPKFVAGKSIFNINYKDNKDQVEKIIDSYRTFVDKGGFIIDSIVLRTTTALDGDYEKNITLSSNRSEALKGYFSKTVKESDVESVFKIMPAGEDWNTLVSLIKGRDDMPNKGQILELLSKAVYPDVTEKDIQKEFSKDYKIMTDSLYPKLHKTDVFFYLHRPDMAEEKKMDVQERPGYEEGLRLMREREYWKAMQLLANYPDYNAALCLACMGYNEKAFEILEKLEPTGNTEYLLAILYVRSDQDQEAIKHLEKALELDSSKVYRLHLDAEITDLIDRYNLDFSGIE